MGPQRLAQTWILSRAPPTGAVPTEDRGAKLRVDKFAERLVPVP